MERADKLSITMPAELVSAVRAAAHAEGLSVSAWLTRAAADAASRQRRLLVGRAEAEALTAEVEPVAEADRERVREFLDALAAEDPARRRTAG
jgi:hypothetical protein